MFRRAVGAVLAGLVLTCVAGCGSSAGTKTAPKTVPTTLPSTVPSTAPQSTSATPSNPASPARGAATKTCVNGWQQPAPGTDVYRQAVMALDQAQGGSGYAIHSVRYFGGPVPNGGMGAIYYLDVRDPRLSARVVLVSTGGPSQAAVAKVGTTGWKDGDWTGFRGTESPAAHPPVPGRWAGPEFDPVTSSPPLLAPTVAGCLDGT